MGGIRDGRENDFGWENGLVEGDGCEGKRLGGRMVWEGDWFGRENKLGRMMGWGEDLGRENGLGRKNGLGKRDWVCNRIIYVNSK